MNMFCWFSHVTAAINAGVNIELNRDGNKFYFADIEAAIEEGQLTEDKVLLRLEPFNLSRSGGHVLCEQLTNALTHLPSFNSKHLGCDRFILKMRQMCKNTLDRVTKGFY